MSASGVASAVVSVEAREDPLAASDMEGAEEAKLLSMLLATAMTMRPARDMIIPPPTRHRYV